MVTSPSAPAILARRLNHPVFWPPFLLMLIAVGFNIANPKLFGTLINGANDWVLDHFGWMYTICAFCALVLCVWILFSPFGRVRLGGVNAKPLMNWWDWFAITICTTIAVGILFWSTAEPVKHYHSPPASLGIQAESPAAARFALAALYHHWSFTPYAIYCVASLMFAFAHYNMRQPFSLGSTLAPILGEQRAKDCGGVIDAVCLYSLVAGMAASLGTGILTISGGLETLWGVPRSQWVWAIITITIVTTFVVSSGTGLMKGIRILSDINAKGLLLLGLIVLVTGPTLYIFQSGIFALGEYAKRFLQLSLYTSLVANDDWARDWSVFYWAVWLAWTPITACFLGRIAYGRTVREFMLVNFIFPALFSIAWMAIFGATTLHLEMQGAGLDQLMNQPVAESVIEGQPNRESVSEAQTGTESVSYAVLRSLPFGTVLVGFYLLAAFVCFVTSADSNTTAMASISSRGVTLENPEGDLRVKIAWGLLVGATAWVMISFADVEGIRMISTLGGFPAAILLFLIMAALVRVMLRYQQFNTIDNQQCNRY